jgi:hypothetical protein
MESPQRTVKDQDPSEDQEADRMAAGSEIEVSLSTQTRPRRFRSQMAGVLCKPPFTEVVEKNKIRCQRSLQDFYQRREQDCSRLAAFKNATVRER